MPLRTTVEDDVRTYKSIAEKLDFHAFVAVLCRRIDEGDARKAYAMLGAFGMEPVWIWRTIDELPRERSKRAKILGIRLATQRSIFLAQMLGSTVFPAGVSAYDWNLLLSEAVKAAAEIPPLPPV